MSADDTTRDISSTVAEVLTSDSFENAVPAARLTVGLKFSSCFCENRHHVYIKVAFDTAFYWNQNNIILLYLDGIAPSAGSYFPVAVDNNIYSLMGLRVSVGWVF